MSVTNTGGGERERGSDRLDSCSSRGIYKKDIDGRKRAGTAIERIMRALEKKQSQLESAESTESQRQDVLSEEALQN